MPYRNGTYCAFYVAEPFNPSSLGAHATKDFVSYSILRAWKGKDADFPFVDSHNKNYSVRDGSSWELTLKPRIHERLSNSKHIVLFLSSITRSSRALREEIIYGIDVKGLPVIVVYPEFADKSDIINCQSKTIRAQIKTLWDKLPAFRDRHNDVPTLHVPNDKALIRQSLTNPDFNVASKGSSGVFFYKC